MLLHERQNTGCQDGYYCFPCGGIDGNETIMQAAAREAKEELGITIDQSDLKLIHVMHQKKVDFAAVNNGRESVHFLIEITKWHGEIKNMEPEKHEVADWFDVDQLPKNLLENNVLAFDKITKNEFYSEFGWEQRIAVQPTKETIQTRES